GPAGRRSGRLAAPGAERRLMALPEASPALTADSPPPGHTAPRAFRLGTLAVLAAVAAALAAVVGITVLPPVDPPAPTVAGTPLVEIDAARISAVEAQRGESIVRYTRTPGGWSRVSPQGVEEIDPDRLDGFLSTLASLKRLSELSGDDLVPADFGL